MNIYLIIIPFILVFDYLLSFIVRTLNLKALSPTLPTEFEDTFDKDKYLKSQDYTRTNSKFSYITSTFSLLLSLVFIFGGVYNAIDQYVLSLGYDSILTGLLFFGFLSIITDILSLPFTLYSTFIIEEKFGFNKTTIGTFFMDKLKGYFLMAILGAPILTLILYFFNKFPTYAWLYAWVLLTIFSLVMQPIFNIFIAPMFNKFTPFL